MTMETERIYVFRDGMVRKLKIGVDLDAYLRGHPGAYTVKKPPSMARLEKWLEDGIARALDGCKVEPDGDCPHGKPSWLKVMAAI